MSQPNKYLILGFKNAGLFRKHRNTKDKMFDMGERKERKDEPEFKEPITVHQISNMLHVLFGERPKPINRVTLYPNVPYLFEKAQNSYIRIDSYKNDKGKFHSETIQTKKSVGNAWNTQTYLSWERTRKLLGDELFDMFVKTIKEVYGFDIDTPLEKVKPIILDNPDGRVDAMFKLMKENKKKPIYDAIYGDSATSSSINMNPNTQLTVLTGLDSIIRLSGEIVVPVTDEDLKKIGENKGCATLLDGGLVYIKGKKSSNIINVDDFVPVHEISLEQQ